MLYPVPAVMVSCRAKNAAGEEIPGEKSPGAETPGKTNIITVAWAGTVCSDPAMVSISVRPSRWSHHIIKESGEFVVNLVTEDLVKACDWCGVRSGRDHDKFREMGLTEYQSDLMGTPAIAESPVNIYCKVKQIIPLGSHDLFLGEVIGVTVDEAYLDEDGRFDLDATGLITYSHGQYFALGRKLGKFGFSVQKPQKPKVEKMKPKVEKAKQKPEKPRTKNPRRKSKI
jgi:flavin reductase (DIM6/NTAB) family NADH-FMN oxidoreductase RutF